MAKSWRPQWPSEEKFQILDEARNTGQTVSEVCRRHQVAMGQFYAWEKQARQGALTALHNGKRGRKPAKSEADLQAQITRRGLLLPSSAWRRWRSEKGVGHNHRRRYTEEEKATILQSVGNANAQSGAPVRELLQPFGLPRATNYTWVTRQDGDLGGRPSLPVSNNRSYGVV